jgi:hypothetical protein
MTNIYDYLISKYGKENYQPNLYEMILSLQEKVRVLEGQYAGALEDIKRLEEDNIEINNNIYEIMNSVDAVDNRIDILFGENNDAQL